MLVSTYFVNENGGNQQSEILFGESSDVTDESRGIHSHQDDED